MIMNVSNSVELMPIFASGRTEFYTLMFYFYASVEEKTWFILLYICTDSQILYRHIYTYVTSKKELICISIMLFSMWLMSALCAGSWHLGTRREVWEDTEEKKRKRGQLGKAADGKQAPQCQCLMWNKCSAFFPKGGSRQADVMGQSLQAQDRTDRETVHTTQSSEWHSFYCSQR